MYMGQIIVLYTLNTDDVVSQLYINKTGKNDKDLRMALAKMFRSTAKERWMNSVEITTKAIMINFNIYCVRQAHLWNICK